MTDKPNTRLTVDAVNAVESKLKPKYYEVLTPWAQGEAYDAIAFLLGIPVGTVKSRINRGRAEVVKLTAAMAHQQG